MQTVGLRRFPAIAGWARARQDALALACLVLILAVAGLVLMHAGRRTTFFFDDWNFVTQRIGWRPYVLLFPHNEHLSIVPVLVYKVLLETAGLGHYEWFRLADVLFNLTCGALLFFYARRRVGAWPSLALAAALVFMGQAYWDVLWAFQIGFLGSLAAGLAAYLALDRGTRRGDAAACALLAISIGSSSLGLPFAAAIAIETLWRRDRWRRLWLPGIPIVLYLVWYLKYGYSAAQLANLPAVADNVFGGVVVGIGALTGIAVFATVIAAALAVALATQLAGDERVPPRLAGALVLPAAFWAAQAIARSGLPPSEPRYLYPEAVFVAIPALEVLRGRLARGRLAAAITAVLALGALANANQIKAGGDKMRGFGSSTRPSLTAIELLGRNTLPPDLLPEPGQPQLFAGRYFTALDAYPGAVGYTAAELASLPPVEGAAVDYALVRIIGPGPGRPPRRLPPGSTCHTVPAQSEVVLALPAGGIVARAGGALVDFRFKRFTPAFPGNTQVIVPAGKSGLVRLRPDSSSRPWSVRLISPARFEYCAVST